MIGPNATIAELKKIIECLEAELSIYETMLEQVEHGEPGAAIMQINEAADIETARQKILSGMTRRITRRYRAAK